MLIKSLDKHLENQSIRVIKQTYCRKLRNTLSWKKSKLGKAFRGITRYACPALKLPTTPICGQHWKKMIEEPFIRANMVILLVEI